MDYIELRCKIEPYDAVISEILVAELGELGYESFVEEENTLLAYITEDKFEAGVLEGLPIVLNTQSKIEFNHCIIKQQNWNETWEKNYFEPIIIEDQCVIRSSFHREFPEIKYKITIDPKMSFGTGHHETTSLVLKEILQLELEGKTVLDMGCGTGILAILSILRGAKDATAVDIDEWSFNNTLENCELNNTKNIHVIHGNINSIGERKFDVIYANINKNVLLNEIPLYSNNMHDGAIILLSGFYQSDFEEINDVAVKNRLDLVKKDEKNNWLMLKYIKT